MDLAEQKGALQRERAAKLDRIGTVLEKDDLTAGDRAYVNELEKECTVLEKQLSEIDGKIEKQLNQPYAADPVAAILGINQNSKIKAKSNGVRVFKDDQKAYNFARFIGAVAGDPRSIGYCNETGINIYGAAQQSSGTNSAGGYLVPTEYGDTLIDLRNEYGIFRKNAFVDTMNSETKKTPRLTGRPTVYYLTEGSQITPSAITLDQVSLTARKPAVLICFSRELRDDSLVALGNLLADNISWAMAEAEDQAGFNGDGTSTYGGIVGITEKLSVLNGVDDGGGLVLGTGNTYSELTLTDFAKMVAACPAYAKRNAKWYCSSYFYAAVMLKLMIAAGGNAIGDLQMGGNGGSFLGFPVVFSETMPTSEANSQICCLFGDLSKAATFGSRENIILENSNSADISGIGNLFERDLYAIRGIERYDINVHDVGTADTAGPVVGLITAAS